MKGREERGTKKGRRRKGR